MRSFTFLLVVVFSIQLAWGQQGLWRDANESLMTLEKGQERLVIPSKYRALALDFEALKAYLENAPLERSGKRIAVEIPLPNGEMEVFNVAETYDMHPNLAARYRSIRSYIGVSQKTSAHKLRFTMTPAGFYGILMVNRQEIYIDPWAEGTTEAYMAYYTADYAPSDEIVDRYVGMHESRHADDDKEVHVPTAADLAIESESFGGQNSPFQKRQELVSMRKFRLAITCTGEYASRHGSTVQSALAAVVRAVGRINFVFERDAAIRMELIERNDELIFTNRSTDPFPSAEVRDVQNITPDVIRNVVGDASFDIGHGLTTVCTDGALGVGGLATVCTSRKAGGASCEVRADDSFYIGTICHEFGHQYGAGHTWNNCPGTNDDNVNYNPGSAYEPGGGTTIMAYTLACGNQNYGSRNGTYFFHVNTIEVMGDYVSTGTGANCAQVIPTGNNRPEVTIPLTDGFFVPISTPFVLTAEGSDIDGDDLTYSWEQYDLDPIISTITRPQGNDPSFRSFIPTSSPTRFFPQLSSIISNSSSEAEVLPTYARDLTFRCSVRDNNTEAGGVNWAEVAFRSDATAGPFLVSYPNETGLMFDGGSDLEITWDVANTDNARVNCQLVNIKLSTDGGNTYPITLANGTPNDGTQTITVPNTDIPNARIMVEAANNIFFDMSNRSFQIQETTTSSFALDIPAPFQQVCLPNEVMFELNTLALGGFTGDVTFAVTDAPQGTNASFDNATVQAGQPTNLTLSFPDDPELLNGLKQVVVEATSGDITQTRIIDLVLISNDFTALQLTTPVDNTRGIVGSTVFEWTELANALNYDFELATSPTFGSTVVLSAEALRNPSFSPDEDFALEDETIYYWRIRPINECGAAAYSVPSAFQTQVVQCLPFSQTEPVNVARANGTIATSTLSINTDGTITDLNIPSVRAIFSPIRFFQQTLISPAGTRAVLYSNICGGTNDLNIGYDDEAPNPIACPPATGIVHQPIEPLSIFDGENIRGDWTLEIEITGSANGGQLESWELESCADIQVSAPFIVSNETFPVPPGARSQIWTPQLEAADEENSSNEIFFQLVALPQHGTLYLRDEALVVGDRFTQDEINRYFVSYEHSGNDATNDSFNFVLLDTDGGWFGTPQFNIVIEGGATVNTEELSLAQKVRIYPNPTDAQLNIELNEQATVRLFNLQGQMISTQPLNGSLQISTSELANGIYWINIQTEGGSFTDKIIVQR